MRVTIPIIAFWFGCAATFAHAQSKPSPLADYQPTEKVAGTIRTWGHGSRDLDFIGPLVRSWESGFRMRQPAVSFETRLNGDKSAIGGLYTAAVDLAMSRCLDRYGSGCHVIKACGGGCLAIAQSSDGSRHSGWAVKYSAQQANLPAIGQCAKYGGSCHLDVGICE